MGDDMFNYYSSNRDSHTEDNQKNDPLKRKSKTISKSKLTKRFDKHNNKIFDSTHENNRSRGQTFQDLKQEQIIIENQNEQDHIPSNKRTETFNNFNQNFNSLAKDFEEEGDTDDSEFQLKNNQNIDKKQKSLENKKKQNFNIPKNNNQPAIRIEDVYSSVEESGQIHQQQQTLDDYQNSFDIQSLNSYRNEFYSPGKDIKQSIQDDQIQEEHQEEEKQNGDPIEDKEHQNNRSSSYDQTMKNTTPNRVESNSIQQVSEQAKSVEKQNITNEKKKSQLELFVEDLKQDDKDEAKEINPNEKLSSSDIKSDKKNQSQKGVQFNFNSNAKNEKEVAPTQTPTINIKTEEKTNDSQYFTEQQQQSEQTIKKNLPLFNRSIMLQSQPQLQMEESSQQRSQTSFYSQIRRFSSRRQSHRKTKFMNEMKSYISHWNQDDMDENKQINEQINETAYLNSKKFRREQTRSLLIPSEITDLEYTYKKNQSHINENYEIENRSLTIQTENKQIDKNLFDKVVIDQNALFLDQNFSPITNSKESLQKLYKSGVIKSASICAFPNIQQKSKSYLAVPSANENNIQQNKENINKQETEQIQLQRSLVLSNYKMSNIELDENNKNSKENLSRFEDENQDEGTEMLNKSKTKDQIQTYDVNKLRYSINGDDNERQQSQTGDYVQSQNVIQSLQNGLRNQSLNPEYETISEMLHTKQRNNTNFRYVDRSFLRQGDQNKKSTRKDPYEEFFNLTAQTVKLNSSYFDVISTVNVAPFYEEAKKLQIPFHKWQEFLLKKFGEIHDKMKQQNKLKYTKKLKLEQTQQQNGAQLSIISIVQSSQSKKSLK